MLNYYLASRTITDRELLLQPSWHCSSWRKPTESSPMLPNPVTLFPADYPPPPPYTTVTLVPNDDYPHRRPTPADDYTRLTPTLHPPDAINNPGVMCLPQRDPRSLPAALMPAMDWISREFRRVCLTTFEKPTLAESRAAVKASSWEQDIDRKSRKKYGLSGRGYYEHSKN